LEKTATPEAIAIKYHIEKRSICEKIRKLKLVLVRAGKSKLRFKCVAIFVFKNKRDKVLINLGIIMSIIDAFMIKEK